MTDRELGFFIGGTLELNVICLTINLQLGRKGWQDSLHMDLKGTAVFSGRQIQGGKCQNIRITGKLWGRTVWGLGGWGCKNTEELRGTAVAEQRSKMIGGLEADEKVIWWVLCVHHSISFLFLITLTVKCLLWSMWRLFCLRAHLGLRGGNTGFYWTVWNILTSKFLKQELFSDFLDQHLNRHAKQTQ